VPREPPIEELIAASSSSMKMGEPEVCGKARLLKSRDHEWRLA